MSTDDRDPRLRELLDVEPLDDVTRRRLVRTALDATQAPPAPRRTVARHWLPVAAAAALVLVVGGVVTAYVRSGDETDVDASKSSEPTAMEAPAAGGDSDVLEREEEFADAGAEDSARQATVQLADLGEASTAEKLAARAESAFTSDAPAPSSDGERTVTCVDGVEPPLAATTGSIDDASVTVLVYADRIVVVDATTCATVSEVAR
jgi:hypothetical protein